MNKEQLQKLRDDIRDEYVVEDDYIEVSDGHKIWYQLWGNRQAKVPFINFHGGPGSSSKHKYKSLFDPKKQLVIFFDQRGCGRSRYTDLLKGNNTQNIVNDAKLILEKLGFNKVNVYGGSWGSTLAMMFAITNPEMTARLIITGVLTADKMALSHWEDGTVGTAYPEIWQKLLDSTPKQFHDGPVKYHMSVIGGGGEQAVRSCAVMQNYEGNIMSFDDDFEFIDLDNIPVDFDPNPYTIFAHFENNNYFIEDGYILNNLKKYKGETVIVHGRFDFVWLYRDAIRVQNASHNPKLYTTISGHKPNHETITVLKSVVRG